MPKTRLLRDHRRVAPLLLAGLCVLTLGACEKKADDAAPEPVRGAPKDAAAPPSDPGAQEPEPAIVESYAAVVTGATVVRKIASDDRYLPETAGAKGDKKKSNWVATLYRGEHVAVTGQSGDFSAIKTSGDEAGFIKSSSLLRADDVKVATVLEEAKTFQRPDILTMNGDKTIDAGAFLYVVNTKAEFSEVNYASAYTRWVRSDALVHDEKEVGAAKLLDQVRYQEGRKESDKVAQLKELGRNTYGDTQLGALFTDDKKPVDDGEDRAADDASTKKAPAPAKDPKAVIDDKTRSRPAPSAPPKPTRARPASAPASGATH